MSDSDDLARYGRRKLRASEVLFNVGFLYVAEGMNQIHEDRDEKLAAAELDRGFRFLLIAREYHAEGAQLAAKHELPYFSPQLDGNLLQKPGAAEVLNGFEKSFKVKPYPFGGELLGVTLDANRDLVGTAAKVIQAADGDDAEKRFRRALLKAEALTADEKRKLLGESALAELVAELQLDKEEVAVSAQGDAPIWDSPRAGEAPAAPPMVASSEPAPGHGATGAGLPNMSGASSPTKPAKPGGGNAQDAGGGSTGGGNGGSPGVSGGPGSPGVVQESGAAAAQRAAEAAALAGARVDSEQIAQVAALSWEMRRAAKEFLFAYVVRAIAPSFPCYPVDSSGRAGPSCPKREGQGRYEFNFYDPRENVKETNGPFLPSACVISDPSNNYCMKAGVPGIPEFKGGGSWGVADPIVAAARRATLAGGTERMVADCAGRTELNQYFLLKALLETDNKALKPGAIDPFLGREGLDRIGILPRHALLQARVDFLDASLSHERGRKISASDMKALREGDPGAARAKAAFEAANNALKGAGISAFTLELEEVASTGKPYRLVHDAVRVHVANSKFETKGQLDRGDCFQFRDDRVIPRFLTGVRAGPNLHDPYEVKVKVKIKNNTITKTAAAAPRKMRIGRTDADELFELATPAKTHSGENLNTLTSSRLFNPLIVNGETKSEAGGFTRADHLGYLRAAASSFDDWGKGSRLAGGLSPWESTRYAPPCKVGAGGYAVNVPVPRAGLSAELRKRVGEMLGVGADNALVKSWIPDSVVERLSGYLGKHVVPDPLLSDDGKLVDYARQSGQLFTTAGNPDNIRMYERALRDSGVCEPSATLVNKK